MLATPDDHPAAPADELAAERAFVAMLYGRLDQLRARASGHLAGVLSAGAVGTFQWRSERDSLAHAFSERIAGLDVGDLPVCFGRIDLAASSAHGSPVGDPLPGSPPDGPGPQFHIGRLALSDDAHEPLLIDWRAPAARPFYQATAGDPQGVVRRRHLLTRGREVTGIDDEVFDLAALSESERAGLRGDAALLAALRRPRTGRMGDIVATIQSEQDRIIRGDLPGVLVVEGGPGTGKTAVALHRAAYLLYTHRARLAGMGVLLVGPNATFLRYIEEVLPALGETGVVLLTPGELFPGIVARRHDPTPTAGVKGDARMTGLLRRALGDRQRVPRSDLFVAFEGQRLRLSRRRAAEIRGRARRGGRPHNQARATVERLVLDALVPQVPAVIVSRLEDDLDAESSPGTGMGDAVDELVRSQLRRTRGFREVMERLWPVLTPQELLNDLFGFAALLRSAGPGLSDAERAALERPRSLDVTRVDWSIEDVPLLDEVAVLLGEPVGPGGLRRRRRDRARRRDLALAREMLANLDLQMPVDAETVVDRWAAADEVLTVADRAARDRTWEFGHAIVDEAQELSPMAWRVVLRRCPSRSMTVVGDLAQAGVPWAPRRWSEVFEPAARGRWRTEKLTVNYRTPAEIMDIAAAVLAAADPRAEPPMAMRDAGEVPWSRCVDRPDDLPAAAAGAVAGELATVGDGRLAVVVPEAWRGPVSAAVRGWAVSSAGVLEAPVSVLTVRDAKGLEFDSVLVVDPAGIIAESTMGRRDLYVALTRSTRRLGVLHAGALPPELAALKPRGRA